MDEDAEYQQLRSSWTPAELWVWERNCLGEIANLAVKEGGNPSPDDQSAWTTRYEIRAGFIEDAITHEILRLKLSRRGLRIAFARVLGKLSLGEASISLPLRMDHCRFEAGADLSGVRASRAMAFEDCVFAQEVAFTNAKLDGGLSLRRSKLQGVFEGRGLTVLGDFEAQGLTYLSLDIPGASVRGCLDLSNSACILRNRPWRQLAELGSAGIRWDGGSVDGDLILDSMRGISFTANNTTVGGRISGGDATLVRACEMQGVRTGSDVLLTDSKIRSLDLTDAKIGGQLVIDGSRCTQLLLQSAAIASDFLGREGLRLGGVHAPGLKVTGDLILDQVRLYRHACLIDLKIGLGLLMRSARARQHVDLARVDVGGSLDLGGSRFEQGLSLQSARIAANLIMWGSATFLGGVDMMWARVGGQVNLGGAVVRGSLNMQALYAGQSVYLRSDHSQTKPSFETVDMQDAVVRGTLYARDATFSGFVEMSSLEVGYVWLRGCVFSGDVAFQSATIAHDLDVANTRFTRLLNLTGATIKGALELGSSGGGGPTWGANGKLSLRDASADVVRDRAPSSNEALGPWPEQIDLSGFTYSRLGGHTGSLQVGNDLADRPVKWYLSWLSRNGSFSQQPYQQLVNVLAKQGEPSKANDVRYAARDRYRKTTKGWQYAGLTLLKVTIGYGIGFRYFLSVAWVAALGLLGAVVFCCSGVDKVQTLGMAWLFSVDQLLPVVKIFAGADDIAKKMTGWPLAYLALHRSLGFMLSSFVVAGLSGITQK